jgi:cytochrome c-type biogenesis protein CcmE
MNTKFLIGGLVILAAIIFLIVSAVQSSAQYSYTIQDLTEKQATLVTNKTNLRVSGFVIGDSIQYNPKTVELSFDIVDTHAELDAPQRVLHVVANGHTRPDLLQHEAQATVTGKLGADGAFYVAQGGDSLLLKCPTRYEEAISTPTPASLPAAAPAVP